MNNKDLTQILELEDLNLFDEIIVAYDQIFLETEPDFIIWKHFYFFIWNSYEDANEEFCTKIDLEKRLQRMIKIGDSHFSQNPEYNFIAGYTIFIFPYLYGENYREMEEKSKNMLQKASEIEPNNLIYRMVYLGCGREFNSILYNKTCLEAAPKIIEQFSGSGHLNKYFRQVLTNR